MKDKTKHIWTGIIMIIGIALAFLSGWIITNERLATWFSWGIGFGVGGLIVGELIYIIFCLNPEIGPSGTGGSWVENKIAGLFCGYMSVAVGVLLIGIFTSIIKGISKLFNRYDGFEIWLFFWLWVFIILGGALLIKGFIELNIWIHKKLNDGKKEKTKKVKK